ncbi:M1 family aminopeptidase [Segetibacter aerophilus]|uniref:Aminopeptidase N n=1 Tax=Segetibacter aerophilus TaxID=670293 RepID=A0A512BJX8_9BACT|nr:M1 family aminopeptidase [Segetibacter aerophilus]GEO12117.1 aminopeptidase [Segetibacter aerophilus]
MKIFIAALLILFSTQLFSQASTTILNAGSEKYFATATKINDLVHTKLDVKFDYSKSWLYGKEWVTVHPHFYSTDSLDLDAKGMQINEVHLVKAGKLLPLKHTYDGLTLHIKLDKAYRANENYTVYISYISKPDEFKGSTPGLFEGLKGLYFINPKGTDKNTPQQIWTQGETEGNSIWFPTIDKPNQKTTNEITLTVPAKYVTLSNGLLISKKNNADGTRTDTWKMDLPHAPYLLFLAVGDYAIVKDKYKNKEVSYYVEKEYAGVAEKIFGLTPEMIAYYSRITGVDFPWPKYAQITGREYIFGAMENTSATLHGSDVQQDTRQLKDDNTWEGVIAHELFHQWFGDYVTTESWSNTTVNESFADYGETMWDEYKYGKDAGIEQNYKGIAAYLSQPANATNNLVRFSYNSVIEMFDQVSYEKGGAILNMLRNYVGDSAFFKSINLYLTNNKFKSAEATNLRLAFEEVTGRDLNWFWNQWYYGSGHPILDISYNYNAEKKVASVFVTQTQPGRTFKLPFAIDVYEGAQKKRYNVWMNNKSDTFSFASAAQPDLINVDGDKMLVAQKKDHKTLKEFVYQYTHAGNYVDRLEAIDSVAAHQSDAMAQGFLQTALKDNAESLRIRTLGKLDIHDNVVKKTFEPIIRNIASKDPKSLVRAKAIEMLGKYKKPENIATFYNATTDSSYSIAGEALFALRDVDSVAALKQAEKLSVHTAKGTLNQAIISTLCRLGGESNFDFIAGKFDAASISEKISMLSNLAGYIGRLQNTDRVNKAVDMIVDFRETLPGFYHLQPMINSVLNSIAQKKQAAGMVEQFNYIKSKLTTTSSF